MLDISHCSLLRRLTPKSQPSKKNVGKRKKLLEIDRISDSPSAEVCQFDDFFSFL